MYIHIIVENKPIRLHPDVSFNPGSMMEVENKCVTLNAQRRMAQTVRDELLLEA